MTTTHNDVLIQLTYVGGISIVDCFDYYYMIVNNFTSCAVHTFEARE